MMKQIGLSPMYKVKVVGLYGVGGIGKTTTCKTLCNKLSNEYEGRVCHVEFESKCSNSKELLQNAVINLTRQSADFVRQLGEGECKDILYNNLRKKQTFLAIDNVWDNDNSIKQARMFLETPFHEDSLVLVTTRSQSTLALLGIHGDACFEMPELGQADAISLFLHYAAPGEQFTTREDMIFIKWCIKKCYFCKGDGRGYHYHPLALEALGRQLHGFKKKPSEWMQHLSTVLKFSSFSGENVVFDVLRSSFDLLQPIEKTLFMDVGFFLPYEVQDGALSWARGMSWKEQLCAVYKKDELEIQSQLDSLKQKGLLQDADLTLERITMHDLYREFMILEAGGNLGAATNMWDRMWMLVDIHDSDLSELEVTPTGGCWQKLSRLFIRQKVEVWWAHLLSYRSHSNLITSLEGIEWQFFSNVLVLQLYDLQAVRGSLNLKGMKCLRSLQLFDLRSLESLEGLESLKHLTFFEWRKSLFRDGVKTKTHIVGQFPVSLKYLYIYGESSLLLESNVLIHCNKLIKLRLTRVKVGVPLDLSNCLSLEDVEISNVKSLQTLSGLPSRLHALDISYIHEIRILGLDQLHGLVRLEVTKCGLRREMPCLLSLTKLQVLKIGTHTKPTEHCIPHQLQELYYNRWKKCEAPCLNAFKHLQVLDFSCSPLLTRMYGMGDLPTLRSLNLFNCRTLERLPNLNKSRELEELNLNDCDKLNLHKEDFAMLATLPLLHPLLFSYRYEQRKIRLDIVRWKVLRYLGPASFGPNSWLAWKEGKWEELELGAPPISFGNRGTWDTSYPIKIDMEELALSFGKYPLKHHLYF